MELGFFKRLNERGRMDKRGLSPLIASVLTILFGVLMLGIVLAVVNPTFNRVQDSSVVSDAFQNMNLLNSAIKEVASESEGSKRTVSISVSDGEYSINSTADLLVFTYEPSQDMRLTGTKGDINIERGSVFLDFFNWYVEDGKAILGEGDVVWTNTSGNWTVDNYKYKGERGLAYHNLSTIENYKFEGKIYNTSGATGGQIFMLPANPERLVGFWALDNHTGSEAYDLSCNGNNGTLPASSDFPAVGNSTSGWQGSSDCKAGVSCLKFDGENDYIQIANNPSLNITSEITVSAWVNIPKLSPSAWQAVVAKTTSNDRGYYMDFATNNKFNFYIHTGTNEEDYASTSAITATGWYHVVGTYDGTNTVIYLNGNLEESDPHDWGGNINSSEYAARIGARNDGAASNFFNGTIDEVKLWNVSLSADEVAAEYELSEKKIIVSGSQSVNAKTPNAAIVLSNPDGVTSFDDIKVSRTEKEQKLVIPYSKIDLNGTLRIVKGNHKVTITHMGTNTTLSKPMIQVTS